MLAREKPHCGVSGVPFMKRTTGADPTAFSIALRVSAERKRAAIGVMREGIILDEGRAACRKACAMLARLIHKQEEFQSYRREQ
jgi:hypothetical protein